MGHPLRSMVRSLMEGQTDGKYKKLAPDITNPDPGERWDRKHNMAWPYGFNESTNMETGDGKIYHPDPVPWTHTPTLSPVLKTAFEDGR